MFWSDKSKNWIMEQMVATLLGAQVTGCYWELRVPSRYRLFYCCDENNMTKSNLERKGFISAYTSTSQSVRKKVQAGTQGRNLEVGTKSMACSFCFLSTLNHQSRSSLPTTGWTLPRQSPNKKVSCRLAHRSVWWIHFFYWSSTSKMALAVSIKLVSTSLFLGKPVPVETD